MENELVTVRITGGGSSFEVILAQSAWIDFICLPSYELGFAVGSLSDTAYLEEHLGQRLNRKDMVTVAAALKAMENEQK